MTYRNDVAEPPPKIAFALPKKQAAKRSNLRADPNAGGQRDRHMERRDLLHDGARYEFVRRARAEDGAQPRDEGAPRGGDRGRDAVAVPEQRVAGAEKQPVGRFDGGSVDDRRDGRPEHVENGPVTGGCCVDDELAQTRAQQKNMDIPSPGMWVRPKSLP